MRIAVNTRFLITGQLDGYGYFIQETLQRICRSHPEHEFIFIFDRPFDPAFIFAENITPVIAGPAARHPVLWYWWYNLKLPAVLRKYKADVLLSPDGFCSLYTRVPQCMVVHDLSFLHHPAFIRKSHLGFFKNYTARFLKKAKVVATVSQYSKKDILGQYDIAEEKLQVVYSAANPMFRPLDWDDREQVKATYTAGREYFLCVSSIHPRKNLHNLLKAFSLFKKRMQSNMQLVIVGRNAWMYESFIKSMATFKYRDDVILTGYLPKEEVARLTAAAYSVIYPSYFEGFGVPVLEALQSGVPVITSNTSSMPEVGGDAALYADPASHEAIAEQMMTIYRDETLRGKLINNAAAQAARFSWHKTAALLWQCVETAAKS
jgi:glycosyltransferase involved in cell wall biosynthesis